MGRVSRPVSAICVQREFLLEIYQDGHHGDTEITEIDIETLFRNRRHSGGIEIDLGASVITDMHYFDRPQSPHNHVN